MEQLITCEITRKNLTLLMKGAYAAREKVATFDMGAFRQHFNEFDEFDDRPYLSQLTHPKCGTAACYAGLGPIIEGLAPIIYDFSNYNGNFNWLHYIGRLFPGLQENDINFLFGSSNPDCLEEAVLRTQLLLEA